MLTYPLTEKAFRGIVAEIAERRAAAAFTPAGSVTTAPQEGLPMTARRIKGQVLSPALLAHARTD
jgi:hypothetical protein